MTTINPYAGERLEHPSIVRTLDADAIRYQLVGTVDRDASGVLARLIRIDLLEARGTMTRTDRDVGKRQKFVIDLGGEPYLGKLALDSLLRDAEMIQREMGTLEFENVSDDLYELLKATKFTRVFTVRRAP